MNLLYRELELLRDLDHPNIISFKEIYQDDNYFHIVMEYCSGGEVMHRLVKKKYFSEEEAAKMLFKMFSAVKYLHDRGIAHRDIKPTNFLYESKDPDAEIKLIDFGLSRYSEPHQTLESQVGTPYYVAPEVLRGSYDHRCDCWSLGVMMYTFLCGHEPFDGKTTPELAKKVLFEEPNLTSGRWANISSSAKNLVAGLLIKDPNKRITIEKALAHRWFKKVQKPSKVEHEKIEHVVENMRHFSLKDKLQKEVFKVLVTQTNSQEIRQLREVFNYFDKHNKGEISIADLKIVNKEQRLKIKVREMKEIMKKIHIEETDTISFSEFLFVAMDPNVYLTNEMLQLAFQHFDVDKTGFITVKNLKEIMNRAAIYFREQEIEQMIIETNCAKNGKISFEDFCVLMRDEQRSRSSSESHCSLSKHEKMKHYTINDFSNRSETLKFK